MERTRTSEGLPTPGLGNCRLGPPISWHPRHRARAGRACSAMPPSSPPSWPKTYSPTEAPSEVLDLTARLMPLLLAGEHPTNALLREQYARSRIRKVELTGAGFFVEFEIPSDVARKDRISTCEVPVLCVPVLDGAYVFIAPMHVCETIP
jgi:hypothetical protein